MNSELKHEPVDCSEYCDITFEISNLNHIIKSVRCVGRPVTMNGDCEISFGGLKFSIKGGGCCCRCQLWF